MKFRSWTIVVAVALAASLGAPAHGADVIARVNGEPITRQEFGRALALSVGPSALGDYVDRVLVEQEAERRGVSVAPEELEARRKLEVRLRLRAVSVGARMGPQEFRAAVERQGASMDELRRQVEQSISKGAMRGKLLAEKMLAPQVALDEETLRAHYERTRGVRYLAAHVLVASQEDVEKMLSLLRERPELWLQAVREASLDRGSLPYKGRIPPVPAGSELGQVLAGMQPDGLAVFQDGALWHVVRFIGTVPADPTPFEKVRDEVRAEALSAGAEVLVDGMLADLNETATVVPNLSPALEVRRILGEDVAVFVNGRAYTLDEFGGALVEELGPQMLESYIERVLIIQEAERKGVTVAEEQIDERMQTIADRLFAQRAERQGKTPEELAASFGEDKDPRQAARDLVEQMMSRDDLRSALLAEEIVADGVKVTEDEVLAVYQEFYGDGVTARDMVFDSATEAHEALRRLQQGADFDEMARARTPSRGMWVSEEPTLNVTSSHAYYPYVQDVEEGDVSGAFRHEGKYHIIKVLRKRSAAEAPPLDSVREEMERRAFLRQARKRVSALLVKLKAEATIEVLL